MGETIESTEPVTPEVPVTPEPVVENSGTLIDEAMTPPVEAVSVSYDELKFQDGLTTEEVQVQKDLFKSLGLSLEAAGKWLEDRESVKSTAAQRAIDEHTAKQKTEWSALQDKNKTEIKTMFGDKLTEKMGHVVSAIEKFLPKEDAESFKVFQRESGLGNHPQFIKFMAGIGELVSEGKINGGDNIDTGTQRLYPNSNMNLG